MVQKMSEPLYEIWLITYRNISKMRVRLESLRRTTVPYHIVVWDNSLDERVYDALKAMMVEGETLIRSPENKFVFGASQAMLDMAVTDAPYIAYFCTTHTEINDPDWGARCAHAFAEAPNAGIMGHVVKIAGLFWFVATHCTGRYRQQHPLMVVPKHLPLLMDRFTREEIFEKSDTQLHVQGGAWVARRKALLSIGGFEQALPHSFGDVELSVRMQCHGWKLADVPWVKSHHYGGQWMPDHRKYAVAHYYNESEPKKEAP